MFIVACPNALQHVSLSLRAGEVCSLVLDLYMFKLSIILSSQCIIDLKMEFRLIHLLKKTV